MNTGTNTAEEETVLYLLDEYVKAVKEFGSGKAAVAACAEVMALKAPTPEIAVVLGNLAKDLRRWSAT